MNRAAYYQKQVVLKLLSSKFVHVKMPHLQFVEKLALQSSVNPKNPEVGSTTINTLFGRRPSFIRTLRRQEKEYRLVCLNLTSNKRYIAADLDCLATTLLPFQLENQLSPLKSLKGDESS
jgi:hypothetical protein